MTTDVPSTQAMERSGTSVSSIMKRDVVQVDMDATLKEALELCSERRIRHLPIVDEAKRLVGIVTDRDLRYYVSSRVGTISETNSDRETLGRHVHVFMARRVVTASPDSTMSQAARLMVDHRIGCLPVLDSDGHLVGIVTSDDLLRFLADSSAAG